MRSYDIQTLVEGEYHVVKLKDPIAGNNPEFNNTMKLIEKWGDAHCEGDYIILLESIIIDNERDALLFKLKYG